MSDRSCEEPGGDTDASRYAWRTVDYDSRQAALESLGLSVLRVSADSVERDLGGVLRRIREALR